MVTLTYKDSYGVERNLRYDNFDEFLLALSGCLTIPDNLKVTRLTYQDQTIPYNGVIGDLYRDMSRLDRTLYEKD